MLDLGVGSGAGAFVIGPKDAQAFRASNPAPARNYKLADGSLALAKGAKSFNAHSPDERWCSISSRVTDVDKSLHSVSQVVRGA